jgi:hypothetical protein
MKNKYAPEPLFNPLVIVLTLAAITALAMLLTTG